MSVKPLCLKHNLLGFVRKGLVALVSCGVVASSGIAKAQTSAGPVLYRLNADSGFQRGCFPPCECAVLMPEPVKGTFLLTPSGSDPLFNTYTITDVHWTFINNGTATVVSGSGTYKVGGEFAVQQELSLFLQMDGGEVEHFDSGLVTTSNSFPDINVSISTNGQYCYDTVFNVSASPTPVPQLYVGIASTNSVVLSWAVSPDPFILQESCDLSTTNWTTVTNTPAVKGQQNQVVLPISPGNRYYRLRPSGN